MSGKRNLRLRPLSPGDADWLLALWNESAEHDSMSPRLLQEKVWGDPDFRPSTALAAEHDGAPLGFAVGVLRTAAGKPQGYVKLLAVRNDSQRLGIGRLLLQNVESVLGQSGALAVRLGESLPNYLVPGVDVRYEGACGFFEARGYRRFDETCNMTVSLDADEFDTKAGERELARSGVVLRRARPADGAAVKQFLDRHWPPWRHEVALSLGRQPPALHLAFRGDELVAFSAFDGNNTGCGSFGPMGTAPRARGLGIGQVLLRRCLRDIKAGGFRQATIPWVAPTGFYTRFVGARLTRRFNRYEKVLKS